MIDTSFDIKVVYDNFDIITDRLLKATDGISGRTATRIQNSWKDNIRTEKLIDTGRYLDSVRTNRRGQGDYLVFTDAKAPGSGAPYPFFLEYGTVHIRPYQVATKAARQHVDQWKDELADIERLLG